MRPPRSVAVVGAGMVGLATAWHLQEHGVEVEVLDRRGVAAGSSWGNAGWLTPSLTVPLPEPAVLAYGLRALTDPGSPLYVPPRLDLGLLRFLATFARNSTLARWEAAMHDYVPLNRIALDAFDELLAGGLDADVRVADPFLAAFRTAQERSALVEELARIDANGQPVAYDLLDGAEVQDAVGSVAPGVRSAVRLHGQRFIDPPRFVSALADAVAARGATMSMPAAVTRIAEVGDEVVVTTDDGSRRFDAAVLATGAWLSQLARPLGVRHPLQAGRGYSFSVAADPVPAGPVYFPVQRIACTPLGGRLRVAGMMEFRGPDAPKDPRRIDAIVRGVAPLLRGLDLDDRQDEWVGSRPVTADGKPLIGPTRSPRIHVAGGHGMWGIALGPATGRLLADSVVTGTLRTELLPFDPLRR